MKNLKNMINLDELRLDFLDYLEQSRGYSSLSVKTYNEALTQMLKECSLVEENGKNILELMPLRLKIKNQNSKTISKKLSAIRSFIEFLKLKKIDIILKSDDSIKTAKTLPKPISHKHILEALEHCDDKETLLIELLYSLGLRISELCSLELDNIHDEWIIIDGKGSKQRQIPLLKSVKVKIDKYISQNIPYKYLFEQKKDKLSQNSIRYIIVKIFKRIGIKATPHQLRHSYASELLNNNARIADVSELLGHSSMSTTQVYTKLGNSLKMQNYKSAHPLCDNSDS